MRTFPNIFQNVITSEISNSVKPKKEIFEYAVAKIGRQNGRKHYDR